MMETYTTQPTNAKWLQDLREIALRQAEEREMSQPQVLDFGKTLQGIWQQLVLQGVKRLCDHSARQRRDDKIRGWMTRKESFSIFEDTWNPPGRNRI